MFQGFKVIIPHYYFLQVRNLTSQLSEVSDEKCRVEERLAALQKSLVEVEEDKRGLDGRMASAQTALVMQEETIRRKWCALVAQPRAVFTFIF